MPTAPPKRSNRDRQPSSKQAEIDANNASRTAKKAQPKPLARSVQAAARKVSAATSGSITSQTVGQPATLVKKRINLREPNKGTERVTAQQRPPCPPTTATSQATRSVITPTPTKTVSHTRKRIHYNSPPPPLNQDADNLEYVEEDIDHEGLVPDVAEEYPSSEATSVPPSEVDFSDNEHREDSENDVSEVHVHKRALSTSSDMGLDQPSKVQKTTRGSSDGRARRRDFDYDVRDLIKTTTDLLRIRLYTINAFPSSTQLEGWIKETWDEACEREKADVVKEKDVHRLLARCPTQLHSAVKNAARNVVAHEYGFSDSVSKKDKARNRGMHSSITTTTEDCPASWLFPKRERDKPAEDRIDIYQTRAISSFTNKTLYDASSRSRLGVRYADLLGPHLTLAHIAFNLTMIQFAISEWEEGFFQDKTFTEDVGRRLYEAHLVDLESYQEAFGEDMVTRLGEALVQRGRTCAGLEPYSVSGTDKGKIARSVFARMAQRAAADTTTTEAYASDDNESGTGSGDAEE